MSSCTIFNRSAYVKYVMLGKSHQLGIVCTSTAVQLNGSTDKITISQSCSASVEKRYGDRFWAVCGTVISGNMASLGCTEWLYFECINSKLIAPY